MFNSLLDSDWPPVSKFRILLTVLVLTVLSREKIDINIVNVGLAFLVFASLFFRFTDFGSAISILFLNAFNLFDILTNYLSVSNHDFLIFYLSIVFLIASVLIDSSERNSFVISQLTLIYGLVMILSGVQKLLSPEFTSGNFVGYLFYAGGFTELLSFIPAVKDWTYENAEFIKMVSTTDPLVANSFHFANYNESLNGYIVVFSWFVIIAEIVLGILALLVPKSKIFFTTSIILIIGILITRIETGFLALLCIINVIIIPPALKGHLITFILILCLSLSFVLIGIGSS